VSDLLLLDTSVAVALLVEDHQAHVPCRRAVTGYRLGLAGHALFETMSVMSRLPAPNRRTIEVIHRAVSASFPASVFLSPAGSERTAADMARLGIGGGAIYDALVAAAAREHDATLATRDGRALPTYEAMGARLLTLT
jgi:predicted nucleic acid-binding protein